MKPTTMSCPGMEAKLAEMLLDAAPDAKTRAHVEACAGCRAELDGLRSTMNLMDSWEAPEPNPYFLTRLGARMREERRKAPEGWLARLRSSFAFGPATHARPLAAMALTVMLLVGGGTYLSLNGAQMGQIAPPRTRGCRPRFAESGQQRTTARSVGGALHHERQRRVIFLHRLSNGNERI